eukprot:CFRG7594T1
MLSPQTGNDANSVTLRGSTATIVEFFNYAVNSILYQRGIYPPEQFATVKKYGLSILVTSDPSLKQYIEQILRHMQEWVGRHNAQKLVLVVCSAETGETLERWGFNIQADRTVTPESAPKEKSEVALQKEIQSLIRQIVASVTFLPLLESACTFELLVYADKDMQTPQAWEESDPKYVKNASDVHLRSFTTTIHKIDAMVSYKMED